MSQVTNNKRKTVYIYPITARGKDDSANPYIHNLIQSISTNYTVVNKHDPSSSGIFQLIKYISKAKYFWFHWIENLPDKKGGILQSLLLLMLLIYLKITGATIIWTMHNKVSHSKKQYFAKKQVFKLMLIISDHIVVHASEGIDYAQEIYKKKRKNIHFIHHPVSDPLFSLAISNTKETDIFIWGSMIPYKGIDLFLKHLWEQTIQDKYTIRIVGKFSSQEYFDTTLKYAGSKTTIENRFASTEELFKIANKSKFIVFTYNNRSVLSSGALMDSLHFNSTIVGPNAGAFEDLSKLGIIKTFNNFEEISQIVSTFEFDQSMIDQKIKFIEENKWNKFEEKINNILS